MSTQNTVNLIKFAHFYNEGARGATGGAPQNDKIWGVVSILGGTFTFFGRRTGKLTLNRVSLPEALAKFEEKTGGRRSGDVYTQVSNLSMIDTLAPNLSTRLRTAYANR